jgi:diadenylate cyclase
VIVNLIDKFGSLKGILDASVDELSEVTGMGKVRARLIYDRLKKYSEYYLYNEPYNRGGM